MDKNLRLLAVAGGALIVVACQSPTPRNVSLDHARRVYQLTRSDPWIAQHAAAELASARQVLRSAERVWADGGGDAATRMLAQLALQQVELARSVSAPDDAETPPSPALLEAGGARVQQTSGSPSQSAFGPGLRLHLPQSQQARLAPAR